MMSEVTRRNNPDRTRASGLMAPIVRATAHMGYMLGVVDEGTDEQYTGQIRGDLVDECNQALRHMDDSINIDAGAYVTLIALSSLTAARDDITAFVSDLPDNKAECLRSLQNIVHNLAFSASLIDHDATGLETTEGSMS